MTVEEAWLKVDGRPSPGPSASLAAGRAERERELIELALAASGGRIAGPAGAAARLGVPRQTLDSRLQALKIDKYRFRQR